MAKASASTRKNNAVRLVVMQGDGIGPEITAATLHVLRAVDGLLSLGLSFLANSASRTCPTMCAESEADWPPTKIGAAVSRTVV